MKPCEHPTEWHQCYAGSHDLWVPEAYSHPAKMAPALCGRILSHLKELGLLAEGDTILDFLCGIGTTVLLGALAGHPAVGVELEPKFVDLTQQNIAHVSKKVGRELNATIIQGDARHLSDLLREQGMIGSTPSLPNNAHHATIDMEVSYGQGQGVDAHQSTEEAGVGREVSQSLDRRTLSRRRHESIRNSGISRLPPTAGMQNNEQAGDYSQTCRDARPQQTEQLQRREAECTIPGPDREGTVLPLRGDRQTFDTPQGLRPLQQQPEQSGSPVPELPPEPTQDLESPGAQEQRPSGMDKGLIAITSPPYEGQNQRDIEQEPYGSQGTGGLKRNIPQTQPMGQSEGQIGQERAESYLSAMRQVYAEAYKVCDVLAVVTKNPTRNGKLRRLDLDTIALLEEVGFTIHCIHRAILFEELEGGHMFEGSQKKVKGRLSFFKRLSYQKGSPVAQWEDVVIAVRDGGGLKGITSPPYDDSRVNPGNVGDAIRKNWKLGKSGPDHEKDGYGQTPGQIGNL